MESQGDLLSLAFRFVGRIRREFAQLMADEKWATQAKLRPGCFGVLRIVATADGISQRDIASAMAIGASDVVALVDRLEAANYVRREADPDDRRRNVVVLTREGRAALRRFERVAAQAEERVLAGLSPTQRERFHDLLAIIVDADGQPASQRHA